MLSIRLSRVGKSSQPSFRLIVSDKRKDPWGKYLELLGTYSPRSKQALLKVDRLKYWLAQGAQASATVHNLLLREKLIDGAKAKVVAISKKRQAKLDAKKAKPAEAAAAAA